jgi:hypothetical protein
MVRAREWIVIERFIICVDSCRRLLISVMAGLGAKKAAKKACRLLRTFCTIVLRGNRDCFQSWFQLARTFQNYEEQIQIENDAFSFFFSVIILPWSSQQEVKVVGVRAHVSCPSAVLESTASVQT